jgi:perosamine synthetase
MTPHAATVSDGARRRASFLHFNLPLVDEGDIASVVETLRSGWLTTGPRVKRFEEQFAALVGSRHAIAVNSATAALHLALDAIGLGAGDEVLVPTMTFAATAEVVAYFRATPVLVDCEQDSLNIDPRAAAAAITPRTRAMIPVHFGGQPCEMDALMRLAQRHRLAVIEDSAHALPATYKGTPTGRFGQIGCFSFYATKTITTGEGGMIVTDDDALAERMRLMSLHGISKDAWKRYTAEGSWKYDIVDTGYKYNLTDIAAALGLGQLAKAQIFREARARIAARYDAGFCDLPEVCLPFRSNDSEHAWHLYVIQLNLARMRMTRDAFIDALRTENIGTSVHFIPLHLHSYYRNRFGYRRDDFPAASDAFDRIVTLPLYPRMTDEDVEDVINAVRRVILHQR